MTIELTRFNDVVYVNAFIARRPRRGRLVYKTSRLTGLWQLELVAKEGERTLVGHYIDGMEDRETVYDIAIIPSGDGYVDEELDEKLHYTPYVVRWGGGTISVTLPHERDPKVVVTAPQICDRAGHPLWEPVYIWRDVVGLYYVLDCGAGLYTFRAEEEFESWVRETACNQGHERPLIHWPVWYVLPGVDNNETWGDVVRRAVEGRFNPSPEDVIALVRKVAP